MRIKPKTQADHPAEYEIVDPNYLQWKRLANKDVWVEFASEHWDYLIQTIVPEGRVTCRLYVYWPESDDLYASRRCVDLEHAQFIAKAFEINAIRNTKRGTDWRGAPWPPKPGTTNEIE
jgi:hypothetical protein